MMSVLFEGNSLNQGIQQMMKDSANKVPVRDLSPEFVRLVAKVKMQVQEVTITDLMHWGEINYEYLLIDVREGTEWQQARVPTAQHLARGILERDIHQLAAQATSVIVLYCSGGYRSALAAHNLMQMGYANVYSLRGGFRAWVDAEQPIKAG